MAGQKRNRTEERNIYYNSATKKYDIKYNYKIYNSVKQKNEYKAKWKYGLASIAEAKAELDIMKRGGYKSESERITLQGAYELWKNRAKTQNYSKATIINTEYYIKMLNTFIPLDTPINEITEKIYEDVFVKCRLKYEDETIKTLNATFRKLINLAYKKKLVEENPLARADNVKAGKTKKIRIIPNEEWEKINDYFDDNKNVRFKFMLNILYYTGIRIGECMALTWEDFEEICQVSGQKAANISYSSTEEQNKIEGRQVQKMRLNINKTILQDGTPKDTTKNKKDRKIPLSQAVIKLYLDNYRMQDVKMTDRIFTDTYNTYISRLAILCKRIGIQHCSCHSFRHTFISNLMRKGVPLPVIEKVSGDTQKTIFDRYSHMFEDDEMLVIRALETL